MSKDTGKKILIGLCVIIVLCLAYFVLPKALVIFLPFILAYIFSLILNPAVMFVNRKLKLPKRLAAGILTLVFVCVIGFLIYYLSFRVVLYVQDLVENWENIKAYWVGVGNDVYERFNGMYASSSPEMQNVLNIAYETMIEELKALFAPLANAVISFTTSFAMKLPSAIIFTVVMFLATYFILSENELIVGLIEKIFGTKVINRVRSVYKDMMKALGGYVRAQLLIMSIVSIPLMIGLYFAKVKSFVLIAILIAVFDALPVFGSGAVLIPWAAYGLITENYGLSIIMIVLYFVVIIARQLLEPKIVGEHIGVPPIFTLISMYAGLKIFGIVGMVLGPVFILIIRNLHKSGAFSMHRMKACGDCEKCDKEEKNPAEDKKGDTDGQ